MTYLPIGQRVRINSLEFLFVRRLTGTVTAQPTDDNPFYRVALDARFGGDTMDARHVELEAMPTLPAEVVTGGLNRRGYYAFRPT